MCGITGFVDLKKNMNAVELKSVVQRMNVSLHHRGPDGDGVWLDNECGIALGHRRLSIIDLSETGAQPMESESGRYITVFNGEIYNFPFLRTQLEEKGHKFKGSSDTEVLLATIEEWGFEDALSRINGMYAFAIWDKKLRALLLARDRVGKKPLYYGWVNGSFVFASELKAFHQHPQFEAKIDRNALAVYFRHNYVPCPWSIYEKVYKLPPASFLVIPFDDRKDSFDTGRPLNANVYWDIKAVAENGMRNPIGKADDDLVSELDEVLTEAVSDRMISDVPLGAFLSGGIDSSLVVALMQKQSARPVRTFSIGFEEESHNEAEYARKVADHLGTDHMEFYVRKSELWDVIPRIPEIFDEPFADASQIPSYHVCRLAKEHVTVALSGDGGDESFAGYGRYLRGQKLYSILSSPLGFACVGTGMCLDILPVGDHLKRIATLLRAKEEKDLYRTVMSYWIDPDELVKGGHEHTVAMTNIPSFHIENSDSVNVMMYADMLAYLPDDILVKMDRTSMAVSLETRSPLLDYRVMEYAWRLPVSAKIRDGNGKWMLRRLLKNYIPPGLYERPKCGFGVPLDEWLRGPLKDWAEELLSEDRLEREGYLNAPLVRRKWQEHLSGRYNWEFCLWGVLMFQAWYEEWMQN